MLSKLRQIFLYLVYRLFYTTVEALSSSFFSIYTFSVLYWFIFGIVQVLGSVFQVKEEKRKQNNIRALSDVFEETETAYP
jgi:hypothetical protein